MEVTETVAVAEVEGVVAAAGPVTVVATEETAEDEAEAVVGLVIVINVEEGRLLALVLVPALLLAGALLPLPSLDLELDPLSSLLGLPVVVTMVVVKVLSLLLLLLSLLEREVEPEALRLSMVLSVMNKKQFKNNTNY